MGNYYLNKMDVLNADGIDFIPFKDDNPDGIDFIPFEDDNPEVIASYSRKEFEQVKIIPKTCYRFWKLINGEKKYID